MALLGLLAALPARLEAQCRPLNPGQPNLGLVSFEPRPPGVPRIATLSSGFNTNLALYKNGGSGPYRLLMQESFGYSVLDLSNPVNPTALYYHDVRLPVGGPNSVTHHGDGQSNIATLAVSPDGQRAAFSTAGPAAPFQTVVGSPGGSGFVLWGDFYPERALSTLVQQVGSRYIAYNFFQSFPTATDVTTLPTGSLVVDNMAGTTENTTWPSGYLATLAGNYILYLSGSGDGIQVIDASSPGPVGSITAGYPKTTITSADFGGRSIAYYFAAVDPADATKVWVLVELSAQAGENSPSYGLLYVTSSLAKVSAGPIWRVPSQTGDVWWSNPGISSALISSNGSLFVLMWAQRALPSLLFELYSTTAAAWGSVNSSAPPGKFDIPTALYSNFSPGFQMYGFSAGTSIYAYLPTGSSAYVIPMSCVSQNAPAVASMIVANQAGAPLNSGDTVFLGDQITITPVINPPPSLQPLTGFGPGLNSWNFDFDFHQGVVYDDNGTSASPRLHTPDNFAFGNPSTPPPSITLVGPCDPQVGGTTPGTGAGCWTSVTSNGSFGGFGGLPDFVSPPTARALTFAFEANNALGSAGASLFTLNWKVPAAKLQSTQVLSAQPLVSGSDGHPTATGFKWYFGATPTTLVHAADCTGPTCVPTLDTRGTYYCWLTASYANGYVTPDYAGSAAMGTYTVTDFAPAFTVNGSTSGPITAITNQSLNVVNSSQHGAGISANYQYNLCLSPCGADNYQVWSAMTDPPPSGSPPMSATIPLTGLPAGNYALKIRVNYTGGTTYWPDPGNVNYFGLNVVDVQALHVTASVSPASQTVGQNVTFSCNATFGLAPYSYEWRSPIQYVVGTQQTWQTTSTVAGNVVAYCYVTDSQAPTPATSSASATATFTGGSPVSVSVSASPNPASVNQTVTFSCNVSGGTGSYTYQWRSPASSAFVAGTGQFFQTSSPTAGSVQAGCTATDSAGASNSNSATVSITGGGGGGSLSVNVSVSPNPATVNQTATFSCNVSGGSPPYTYQWRSPATSSFVAGTSQTFQTSSPTPTSIQAGCTATDSAGASSSNKATVTIEPAAPPAATCVDVSYTILDRDNGYISIPLSSALGIQYFGVASGQNLVFQATGTGINTADWTFGDGGTGSGNPIWYTYMTAGTFTATVTLNSNTSCSKSYSFHVTGPSGLFTARYADNSVFSSTNVESGKDLSFLATDTADSYAWSFGDGFTATGKNPTHAFRVNGSTNVTFTTTLTVTIGAAHWSTSQTFTVIAPPEPPKWFVAGLAYTQGAVAGTVWQSDMTILNPDPTLSATYSLAFLDAKNPVAPKDLVWKTITVPAQQIASASNVVSTFFGKSLGSYGAVIVRGDVAPVAPAITSRTYNNGNPGKGTFGLSVPPAQATSGVSQQSSAAQQLLIGLRDDGSAYTNIGLVNLVSADWTHARLTFFDAAGASLGVILVDVPPYGVSQLNKPLTSGLGKPPLALYRVQVTVDSGGAVYPYATVIDQISTDPIAVTPTEQPLNTYRVPGIVRSAGANNTVWRSRFVLHNASTSARKVSILYSYVPCDTTGCGGRQLSSGPGDVSMAPGETKTWDDFPGAWLTAVPGGSVLDSVAYGSSYIDVAPASGDANQDPLLVLGMTFNSQPTGLVGLQLSGFTDLDGGSKTGAGKRLLLTGLASNADFRTNVAFFLTSGKSGHFNVRVLSDTGVTLKTFGWDLTDSSPFKQFSDSDLFGGVNKSDWMSIIVDSFDGSPVAAYATIIDNKSGAATFVKAQPAP